MANNSFKFGMIGLGVMGRNLLLNMARPIKIGRAHV